MTKAAAVVSDGLEMRLGRDQAAAFGRIVAAR
jgi:hypothetical protein